MQWDVQKTVWSVSCNQLLTQTAVRDWEDCDLYQISCWLRLQWEIEKTVWSVCNQLLIETAVRDWEDCVICMQSAADSDCSGRLRRLCDLCAIGCWLSNCVVHVYSVCSWLRLKASEVCLLYTVICSWLNLKKRGVSNYKLCVILSEITPWLVCLPSIAFRTFPSIFLSTCSEINFHTAG